MPYRPVRSPRGTILVVSVERGFTHHRQFTFPERLNGVFAAGAPLATMTGLMWNWSFPMSESVWMSSYVLLTAGLACVVIAATVWNVDV